MIRSLPIFVCLFAVLLPGARSEEWTYAYAAGERDAFVSAEFTLSLDPQVVAPKGVIVMVGPQNVDERDAIKSPGWIKLAAQQNCALLGCKFLDRANSDFSHVDQGGRAALLASLVDFSKRSERLRDLDRLKMVLVGRLAGAQFVYEFAVRDNDRVAGFVCINPYYFNIPPSGVLRRTPAFFLVTENEHPVAAASVLKLFNEQRTYGALWGRVFWDSTRKINLETLLSLPFVEQTVISRIDRRHPLGPVENMNINDGWSMELGKTDPPSITESRNVPRGKETQFSWFISENLAEAVAKLLVAPAPK